MADETKPITGETIVAPGETLPPVEVTKKPARTRSLFDVRLLKDLALAQSVARAAQRPECVGPLAARNVTPAQLAALLADALSCQDKFARVVSGHGQKTGSTASESSLHTTLLHRVTDAQTSATQAWSGKPERRGDLDAYGIGQPLKSFSRPNLETIVSGILQRIEADNLPGVTKDSIAALQSTFDAWKSADAAQTTQGTDAAQLLVEAKRELTLIKARRITVQIAADGAFPHYDKDNYPIRSDFGLPKSRPYRPVRE